MDYVEGVKIAAEIEEIPEGYDLDEVSRITRALIEKW